VPIVAALWAQLALHKTTWEQLWRATAVGYEIGARLGARLRIKPGMHVDGVWSAFGAAAAVVMLRGGDWACARRAIEACAAQLPFSLYRPIRQGATIRNLYLGHSAWLGLQAAQAALSDWTMPAGCIDDVLALALDGGQGAALPGPGEWLLLQSYWKPFAAVRHVHYGAQAALRLRANCPPAPSPTRCASRCTPRRCSTARTAHRPRPSRRSSAWHGDWPPPGSTATCRRPNSAANASATSACASWSSASSSKRTRRPTRRPPAAPAVGAARRSHVDGRAGCRHR
jgi:hypothetical protein